MVGLTVGGFVPSHVLIYAVFEEVLIASIIVLTSLFLAINYGHCILLVLDYGRKSTT